MKLFIDSADVQEIRQAYSLGVIDGVTTNPTHIARVNRDRIEVIKEILEIVNGPISVEAVATNTEEIVAEARTLASIDDRIVIKVPIICEGLKAVKRLSAEGIKTNVTLVFSANQALLAAKAGASYVSPFVNRLDVVGSPGLDMVREIIQIFLTYQFTTEIIAASILNPRYVTECALAGAHIVTLPYPVFEKTIEHPMTKIGLEGFLRDWETVKAKQKQ